MAALFSCVFLTILIIASPWFHGLTGFRQQLWAQMIIYPVLLTLILWTAVTKKNANAWLFKNPFDRAAGWGLAFAGFFVVISVLPAYSLLTWVRFGSVVAVYVIARQCCARQDYRFVLACACILMGTAYSVYGLMQYYGPLPKDYWYTPFSFASRYVNGGHFAALMIFPFYAAAFFTMRSKSFWVKGLTAMIGVFFGGILILTQSRTVWICLFFSGLLYLGLLVRYRALPPNKLWMLLLLIAAACVGLSALGLLTTFTARFLEIWDGKQVNLFSILQRFAFWEGSLDALGTRPWGWGLGTFVHIYPQFKTQADRFTVDYAHNEMLQWGVDTGIFGILFFLGLFGCYLSKTLRYLRECADTSGKIEMAAYMACSVTLLAASQFDFPLRIYTNALFFSIVLAAQASLLDPKVTEGSSSGRPAERFV